MANKVIQDVISRMSSTAGAVSKLNMEINYLFWKKMGHDANNAHWKYHQSKNISGISTAHVRKTHVGYLPRKVARSQ
jgi:hypothetical protein